MNMIMACLLVFGQGTEDARTVLDKAWAVITGGQPVETVLLVYGKDKQYRRPKSFVFRYTLDMKQPRWREVYLRDDIYRGSAFDGATYLSYYGLERTVEECVETWLSAIPNLLANQDLEANLVEQVSQDGVVQNRIEVCYKGKHLADLWFDEAYHLKRLRYSISFTTGPDVINYYFGPYRNEFPRWPRYWQRGERNPHNYELLQFELNPKVDDALFTSLEPGSGF